MSDFNSVADILRVRTLTKPKDPLGIAVELVAIQMFRKELKERKMNNGYIKLYRSIRNNPMWYGKGRRYKFAPGQAFIDLLLMADHKDGYKPATTGKRIMVKRGEVFTSQRKLAEMWKWHRNSVKTFLLVLQNDQIIGHKTDRDIEHGYTIITINNYEKYQGTNGESGHKNGHQLSTNKNIQENKYTFKQEEGRNVW